VGEDFEGAVIKTLTVLDSHLADGRGLAGGIPIELLDQSREFLAALRCCTSVD
jgi:hypothetical protein